MICEHRKEKSGCRRHKILLQQSNNFVCPFTALPAHDQVRAISMLCLLLPHENRNTMRELLSFLKLVVELQSFNKMSTQNVATITAPSFFPPRFVHPTDKNDISAQVRMAAQCCQLTNVLISQTDNLWMIPQRLIDEAKKFNKTGNVSDARQSVRSIIFSCISICLPNRTSDSQPAKRGVPLSLRNIARTTTTSID